MSVFMLQILLILVSIKLFMMHQLRRSAKKVFLIRKKIQLGWQEGKEMREAFFCVLVLAFIELEVIKLKKKNNFEMRLTIWYF
jgi:hypothetical protein